jgi:hypothetical protein
MRQSGSFSLPRSLHSFFLFPSLSLSLCLSLSLSLFPFPSERSCYVGRFDLVSSNQEGYSYYKLYYVALTTATSFCRERTTFWERESNKNTQFDTGRCSFENVCIYYHGLILTDYRYVTITFYYIFIIYNSFISIKSTTQFLPLSLSISLSLASP